MAKSEITGAFFAKASHEKGKVFTDAGGHSAYTPRGAVLLFAKWAGYELPAAGDAERRYDDGYSAGVDASHKTISGQIERLRGEVNEGNAKVADRDATITRLSAANGRLKRANEGLSEQVIYRDAMVTSLHAESDKSYRDMRAAERRETAAVSKAASLEVVEALAFRGMSITTEQYWHDCADWCDANGKRGYAEAIRKMVHALAAYEAGKPAEQVAEEPAAKVIVPSCGLAGCPDPAGDHGLCTFHGTLLLDLMAEFKEARQ